jgi:site-specific DNA recombinase
MVSVKQAAGSGGVTTALIYTRVSSDEQAKKGLSLDVQLAECRKYAARQGWMVGESYRDVMTGKKDSRPSYQAMLAEARRLRELGKPVAIVAAALDRLGRRTLEQLARRAEMKGLGVPLHAIREGGEVGDVVAGVLAVIAEDEIRKLGERVSKSAQHALAGGWRAGGKPPWGYLNRPATEAERAKGSPMVVLDIDPMRAPFPVELFRRAAEGEALGSLEAWIAALPELPRGGRKMSGPAVKRLLKNPVFIARQPAGEGDPLARPVGNWPALVDDATWAAVRARFAAQAHLPRHLPNRHLLSGFLTCPRCGELMRGDIAQGKARYRCENRRKGADAPGVACTATANARTVNESALAQAAALLEAAADPGLRKALERAWAARAKPTAGPTGADRRKALEAARDKAGKRLRVAGEKLVDGVLDDAAYRLVAGQAAADLEVAEKALAELASAATTAAPTLPPLGKVLASLAGWRAALEGAVVEARRDVLALLIARAEPVNVAWGVYTARIEWTALGEWLGAVAEGLGEVA